MTAVAALRSNPVSSREWLSGASIMPVNDFNAERAPQAAERLRALLAAQGPPVSEAMAAQNWEELKRELETEDNEQMDQWLLSSMPR